MIKRFLFIEDGSVDIDALKKELKDDTKIIVYRQGSVPPLLIDPSEPAPSYSEPEERLDLVKTIPVGKTFSVAGHDFIVLEHSGDTTAVIFKDLLTNKNFDNSTNNWTNSALRKYLNGNFYTTINADLNDGDICEHTTDLTADDGLKCYGSCVDKIGLLTADQYRKYVDILDNYNPDKWWWLATPLSTPKRGCSSFVRVVGFGGTLGSCNCDGVGGARPFLILKSSALVLVKEEL